MTPNLRDRVLELLKHFATAAHYCSYCEGLEDQAEMGLGHTADCKLQAIKAEIEAEIAREKREWTYSLEERHPHPMDLEGVAMSAYRGEADSLAEALRGIDPGVYRVRWIHGNCTPEELAAAKVDPVLRKWFD